MSKTDTSFLRQSFSVSFEYKLHFTEGLFEGSNPLFRDVLASDQHKGVRKVLFVLDSGLTARNPALVDQIESHAAAHAEVYTLSGPVMIVDGGERVKNSFAPVERILEATHIQGIDRHSYIVGIGGGALLDAVGFAASIAHRGIRHIRVPTTVLSQNDGGVGVKNGINYFGKKNYLGSFTPPFAIIDDFSLLQTLHDRDWRAGMSEAVKVALLKDPAFFDFLEKEAAALDKREMEPMQWLIRRCAELHLEHIASGDPFELGSSRPLDFGHWAAHKLEQLSDFRIRHGEAVAIGIALDVCYSQLKGMLAEGDCRRILNSLQALGFDLWADELLAQNEANEWEVLSGLNEFREHLGGELTIMLLEGIGKGVEVHSMDHSLLQEAIEMLKTYRTQVNEAIG